MNVNTTWLAASHNSRLSPTLRKQPAQRSKFISRLRIFGREMLAALSRSRTWDNTSRDEPSEDVGYRRDGQRRKYGLITSKGLVSSRKILKSYLKSMESIINMPYTHRYSRILTCLIRAVTVKVTVVPRHMRAHRPGIHPPPTGTQNQGRSGNPEAQVKQRFT